MHVILSALDASQFPGKNLKLKIKIIAVLKTSTIIKIKNKEIEIPYVLNKESQFFFIKKDNSFQIHEVPPSLHKINQTLLKKISDKKNESLHENNVHLKSDYEVRHDRIANFFDSIFFIDNSIEEDFQKSDLIFSDITNNEIIFCFKVPFFLEFVPVFLKISSKNKNNLLICVKKIDKKSNNIFIEMLKKRIGVEYNNLSIYITDNRNKYIKKIVSLLQRGVDLHI